MNSLSGIVPLDVKQTEPDIEKFHFAMKEILRARACRASVNLCGLICTPLLTISPYFLLAFFINLTMIYHILKAQYFTEVLKLLKKLLGV